MKLKRYSDIFEMAGEDPIIDPNLGPGKSKTLPLKIIKTENIIKSDDNKINKYFDIFRKKESKYIFPGTNKEHTQYFKVIDEDDRSLVYSSGNDKIFKALGYDKEVENYAIGGTHKYHPDMGDIGVVIGEYMNPETKKIWCWFVSENGENCVINKGSLRTYDREAAIRRKEEAEKRKDRIRERKDVERREEIKRKLEKERLLAIKKANEEEEKRKQEDIITRHLEYIEDVFLRIHDLGKYNIDIRLSDRSRQDKSVDKYTIFIRNINYRPNGDSLIIFDSLEDYFDFNKVIKIVLNQLSYDYEIINFKVKCDAETDYVSNKSYMIILRAKNLDLK